MFGYGVDAVGEGMEGVTDYVLNNAVQRTYDPSAPKITIRGMVQVLGKDATLSLILGAMPREAGYQAARLRENKIDVLNSAKIKTSRADPITDRIVNHDSDINVIQSNEGKIDIVGFPHQIVLPT